MEIEQYKNVGRNDPCPCGSGKKFKKCHEGQVSWQGNTPSVAASAEGSSDETDAQNMMPGFDPSKMDLNWLAEFSGAIQRLPKGQLIQLQTLMQKAMAGKDVTRELEDLQRRLPGNVQELLKKSPELDAQMAAAQTTDSHVTTELTDEQKLKLQEIQKNNQKSGLSKLWSRFTK